MPDKSSKLIHDWKAKSKEQEPENAEFLKSIKTSKPDFETKILPIHKEVFEEIDCLACANCCKTTPPIYTTKDVKRIARHLGVSPKQFKREYTIEDIGGELIGISVPCSFLNEDNTCQIYEVRPLACRTYPHTDDPAFVHRPDFNLKNTIVCPAAFHIVERLKDVASNG